MLRRQYTMKEIEQAMARGRLERSREFGRVVSRGSHWLLDFVTRPGRRDRSHYDVG